jgi:DHA1 family inner membrane transport protein
MGIYHTAMPLGTILSLNFLSLLGARMGWRASIWTSTAVSSLTLVVFLRSFALASRKNETTSAPAQSFIRGLKVLGMPIWYIGATWLFFNAGAISLFTFTPDFLNATGLSVTSAGFYTSILMWPALAMGPLVGWVIDKIGRKRMIAGAGGIILTILILWLPNASGWMFTILFLIGVAMALVPTPVFALVPDVIEPERLGLGYGIIRTCVNLGIMIGPFATGWVKDVSGTYRASYILMAGFVLLVPVSMVFLGRRQ